MLSRDTQLIITLDKEKAPNPPCEQTKTMIRSTKCSQLMFLSTADEHETQRAARADGDAGLKVTRVHPLGTPQCLHPASTKIRDKKKHQKSALIFIFFIDRFSVQTVTCQVIVEKGS